MSDNKDKDSVNSNRQEFEGYFKEDLEAIEEELEKSKEYSEIIDKQIKVLTGENYGANKTAQHYLIEHIANAVQLQTQRQGLRKDRFAIKKAILDYSAKFADNTDAGDKSELIKKIEEIIKNDKQTDQEQKTILNENLDSEIDKILEEDGE